MVKYYLVFQVREGKSIIKSVSKEVSYGCFYRYTKNFRLRKVKRYNKKELISRYLQVVKHRDEDKMDFAQIAGIMEIGTREARRWYMNGLYHIGKQMFSKSKQGASDDS